MPRVARPPLHFMTDMSDCLFCRIIAGEIPAEKVFEDDRMVAFMDIQPINPGHLLVVPKEHSRDLTEMSPEDVGSLFRLVQHVARSVRDAVGAPGFNIGVNTGGAAGQVVFHTHVHVMPRFDNDGHRHWEKKPMSADEIAEVAGRIRASLATDGR